MSRSGYSDSCDGWDLIRWRGAVAQATRGVRGQQFLKELLAALDAMPEKRLIANHLEVQEVGVCAIGCLGKAKSIDMANLDPEEPEQVAKAFGIASALVQEIVYHNDECGSWDGSETPEQRWQRMRNWVSEQILTPTALP